MTWKDNLDEKTIEQYNILTKELKHITAQNIKENNYVNLRCPNTKSNSNIKISDYKSRINIIARPDIKREDERTNKLGDLEIMVVVKGNLNNSNNYKEGVYLPELIIIPGEKLYYENNFMKYLDQYFSIMANVMKTQLTTGQYEIFVPNALELINGSLSKTKLKYK